MHFAFRLAVYFSLFAALVLTLRRLTRLPNEGLPYEATPHPEDDPALRPKFLLEQSLAAGSHPAEHVSLDMMPMEGLSTEQEVDYLIKLHRVLVGDSFAALARAAQLTTAPTGPATAAGL